MKSLKSEWVILKFVSTSNRSSLSASTNENLEDIGEFQEDMEQEITALETIQEAAIIQTDTIERGAGGGI